MKSNRRQLRATLGLRAAAAAALVFCLAGCGGGSRLVDGRMPVVLGGTLQFTPRIDWSRVRDGRIETWTVDGAALNALTFVKGAGDGDPLVALEPGQAPRAELPVFDSDMTPLEVHDLYVASLSLLGFARVETSELAAWTLDDRRGFRFSFRHRAADGLDRAGLAAGTVLDGELWLITYTAPKGHYFEKYRAQVEDLLASAKLR